MKFSHLLGIGALTLAFAAGGALAQDKAARQAEIVKVAQGSLERFYKAKPELKSAVAKAPPWSANSNIGENSEQAW